MGQDKHVNPAITSTSLTRRKLLGSAAGAGAAALMAGSVPGSLRGSAVVAQDGERVFHAAWPYESPPTGHYNNFLSDSIFLTPNIYGDMMWQPFAMYTWSTQEWLPLMATNWGFITEDGEPVPAEPTDEDLMGLGRVDEGATIFQVKLREGALWSDGNPFTTEDVVATYHLLRLMSDISWQYLESVQAVDETTVNFVMTEPSTVIQRYILRNSVQSHALYGEWADEAAALFEEGQTLDDPDMRQLLDRFTQFQPEEIIASGPFIIDMESVTSAEMSVIRNDQAWNADQVGFDRIVNFNGRGEAIIAIIVGGSVDYGTQAFPPSVEAQMEEDGMRIIRPPIYSGPGILFNYGRFPQLLDKRVRQAFAMIIDRQQNGVISLGESGVAVESMAGFSDNVLSTWMTEDDIADLNPYAHDHDAATALLEEAGWTKDGDRWIMEDGTPAEFELLWPSEFPDWSAAGADVADQLTDFGIEIIPTAVAAAQQPVDVDQGNFDLAIRGWGNSTHPHPHFSFTQAFFTHNTLAINAGGQGTQFPLVQPTDIAGEVDLNRLTVDAAQGLDEEAQMASVTTIAKVYNELVPVIPLWERYGNNSILEGERVGEWPDDENPVYQNSPYADGIVTIFMLTGQISPVE